MSREPAPYERGHVEPGPDIDVRGMHDAIMREKAEPRDGHEPIPLWLIFVYFGIIAWIGVYLGLYNAGFDPDRYDHRPRRAEAAAADAPQEVVLEPLVLGKRLYSNCRACHQADGQGVAGQFPPLVDSEWLVNDPETPIRILLNGLEGPIEVRGETYDAAMPAFGRRLTDMQIAAVLTYVRQEWGNDAPAIDAELVASVRAATDRTGVWSAEALREARASSPAPVEAGDDADSGDAP